jgi:N-acetylglucosaminyldiphosphoundecaprenol N-acetyl-beta-D-mannosaminyltransferase
MGTHNLHSIYLFARDSQFRRFYAEARTVHIDGMSLVYIARLFGFPVRREHRVTYLDWIFPLMETSAQRGWRVFYLGGKPGVAEKASQRLKQRFPELHLDTHHGYFEKTTAENDLVVEKINSYRPNILMVGMGMPIEEHWVLNNSSRIHPCVIMVPGACFDYIAGAVAMPPRWMGRIGLEWLFRLASEPRRLWRRYLVEPWYILVLIVKELFR